MEFEINIQPNWEATEEYEEYIESVDITIEFNVDYASYEYKDLEKIKEMIEKYYE